MILNSTQSVHTSNPLDTSISKRVVSTSRSPAVSPQETDSAKQKAAEQAQKQYDQRLIAELQARDRKVRAHEAAHKAAGGNLVVGGPSFTYQRGPDGRSYAIGGEERIDVSAVANDPEATLRKSEQVRRAALAPSDPSPQDLKVASSASQLAGRARIEIALQRREEALLEEKQGIVDREQSTTSEAVSNESSNSISGISETGFQLNETPRSNEAINAFTETAQPTSSQSFQINQFA